jgi:hypothetical protein
VTKIFTEQEIIDAIDDYESDEYGMIDNNNLKQEFLAFLGVERKPDKKKILLTIEVDVCGPNERWGINDWNCVLFNIENDGFNYRNRDDGSWTSTQMNWWQKHGSFDPDSLRVVAAYKGVDG